MLCLCIFTQPEALQPFHVVAGISPLLRDSLLSHGPWYYGMIEGRLGSEEEGEGGREKFTKCRAPFLHCAALHCTLPPNFLVW